MALDGDARNPVRTCSRMARACATRRRRAQYRSDMRIGIIGASGNIGSRLVAEATARGHEIAAYTRRGASTRAARPGVTWRDLDIFDLAAVTAAITTPLDVLISTYQPGNAATNFDDTVERSIADPTVYARAAAVMVRALEARPATRLIVVGGAGSLERTPGHAAVDDDATLAEELRGLGLPESYAVAVRGHRDALRVLRLSNRWWTYVSPSEDIHAGVRTGRFRLGGDQILRDADGRSQISFEDFAAAIVDEIEIPRHVQRRFTVGY